MYNQSTFVELTAYMAIRLNASATNSTVSGYKFELYYLNQTNVSSGVTDWTGSAVLYVERVYVFNGMNNTYQVRGSFNYGSMYQNITSMVSIPSNQYTYEQTFNVDQAVLNETVLQVYMTDNFGMPASSVYVNINTNRTMFSAYSDYQGKFNISTSQGVNPGDSMTI